MTYSSPTAGSGTAGRHRLLPPSGCPGLEQWVLAKDLRGWLELGYREGPVPAAELELFWLAAERRWDEAEEGATIELVINPRQRLAASFSVSWGDGSSETVPWSPLARRLPRLRHHYTSRADLTVQVQLGPLTGQLAVHLLSCPATPARGSSRVQALLPGGGISGEPYDGRKRVTWQLRLHPGGGLALLPDPDTGELGLAVAAGSGGRASRWYGGNGPPPQSPSALEPPAAVGDFYLDRLSGDLYELS